MDSTTKQIILFASVLYLAVYFLFLSSKPKDLDSILGKILEGLALVAFFLIVGLVSAELNLSEGGTLE